MKRRAIRDNSMLPDEIGQDSFLDTVFNLVGILIVLVAIVGAHSGSSSRAETALAECQTERVALENSLTESGQVEDNVRRENAALGRQIEAEEQMTQLRSMERGQILLLVQQLENDLAAREANIGEVERKALDRRATMRQLQQRLDDVQRHAEGARAESRNVQAIDHFPTPIAKTVFRDDVHFRMKEGKIAEVPLDSLVQLMRNEWEVKAEKLRTSTEINEAVGPISGFRLQYKIVARQRTIPTSAGPVTHRAIEFDHFRVVPLMPAIGEPVAVAMQPGSEFCRRLEQLKPEQHTISVWVYPDSYREFNELKSFLYQRGFQTASWPLSEGGQITGGPRGYHTIAQ